MAGVLQHLRSSTLDKRPNPASMVDGQVAINYASGAPGMFFKNSNGDLVKVGPVHVGSSAPNVSPASGGTAGNSIGEQWLDNSGGTYVFKIWDGSAWRSEAGEFVNTTGDTMTGALGVIAGSASTPGLFFSGDANSGLYSPGADQVAVATNGTQRLNINSAGSVDIASTLYVDAPTFSVGLGTASPSEKLDVVGNINLSGVNRYIKGGGHNIVQVDATKTYLYGGTGGVQFRTADNLSALVDITNAGLVGIGTSSPGHMLSVVKATAGDVISFTNAAANNKTGFLYSDSQFVGLMSIGGASNNQGILFDLTNGKTLIQRIGGTTATFDSSGRVGIGTTNPGAPLEVNGTVICGRTDGSAYIINRGGYSSGTVYSFWGNDTTGISNPAAGQLGFLAAGSERARIDSSGRLGIGTSSPATGLHIANTPGGASTGNVYVSHVGQARYKLYNGGAVCEWLFGQKTSSDHAFTFSKLIGPTESDYLVITSAGNVGIGTASPSAELHVNPGSGNAGNVRIDNGTGSSADGYLNVEVNSGGALYETVKTGGLAHVWYNTGAERMRIDTAGRLLVGTSTAEGYYSAYTPSTLFTPSVQVKGTYPNANLALNTTNDGSVIHLVNSSTSTSSGRLLGAISFNAADGTNNLVGAGILAYTDAPTGTNDMPGRLVFSTTADGASSPTERMRITSEGSTGFLNGSTVSNTIGLNSPDASSSSKYLILGNRGASNTLNNTGTSIFQVRTDGGIANFSANNANLSDRNSKKDIAPAADTWDCVKDWEVVNYRYKDQPDDADLNIGVIAQQVAESCPEVITVFEEAKDDQPEKLGVKEQQMYWMAIKALQEAQVRIETLEAEVTALKAQ